MNRQLQYPLAGLIVGVLLVGKSHGQDLCPQLVGTPVDLSDGTATQRIGPVVARNSASGEYMVVWSDDRNPGNNDIFGQRVAADGQRIGGNIAIRQFADSQTNPSIAYGGASNEFLVTWLTQEAGHFNHAHGRRVAADGSLPGGEFHVANSGDFGSLAYDPDLDQFLYLGSASGVSYRIVAEGGGPIGSEMMMPDTTFGDAAGHVRYDNVNNVYFTTWRDSSEAELDGRFLVGVTGTPASLIDAIGTNPGGTQPVAASAFDPALERFLVVYGTLSGTTIKGRFVTSDGAPIGGGPVGPEFTIGTSASAGNGAYVVRVPTPNVFLVTWSNGDDIVAQMVATDGTLIGTAFFIETGTGSNQPPHMVARQGSDEVLVVWRDRSVGVADQEEIFGRIVRISNDPTGLPDCDGNGVNDACDVTSGNAADCDDNAIPDVCEPDFDGDGTIDACDDDIDGDGVANANDVCDFTPPDVPAQYIEPDGSVKGDLDADCDVDLDDFVIMQVSITGPNP